jgi:uncharacterized protein (DUF169 family)
MDSWSQLSDRLSRALHLTSAPIAITFCDSPPSGVEPFGAPMPPPTPDGRTGAVPAGCVFWNHATTRTFATVAADHGNCSVGSLTHGLIDLETAATRADVGALVESGWVTPEVFPQIPVVAERPAAIIYGPLASGSAEPHVVLIRTNPLGLMTITDAVPDTMIEGKPQCHIVAIAKEQGRVAASVGCALSRARTGMAATDFTCALPGSRLAELVDAIERAATVDAGVARYAGDDAARFASNTAS